MCAELARHARVKSWIVERQGEQGLEVDPGAYRVSHAGVGERLRELQDGDQCEPRRVFGGLAFFCEQVLNVGCIEQVTEGFAQEDVPVASGERGFGDSGSFFRNGGDWAGFETHG
jgi:hypothetical protein